MKHIEKLVQNCSKDHIITEAYQKFIHLFWVNTFLIHLNEALESLYEINIHAYNDFIKNKLVATNKNSFNKHSLMSSLCELCIMNSFINQSDFPKSFVYEPKLRDDNNKNVEFSIQIKGMLYNVEVKSPNLTNYYRQLNSKIEKCGVVTRFDTRAFGKPEQPYEIPSPNMRVKDFLVDSNKKFPQSNLPQQINVLFIAWDANTDQPCIELKHPIHGLLTPNSWYKDNKGNPIPFSNIDLIFISDLYQNIIAHLSSGATALPNFVTGVPYFERNDTFPPYHLNPFYLSFSRNVLTKPDIDLCDTEIEKSIFNILIAFQDQTVEVIDEKYVSRYGADMKISYKI